MPTTIEQGFEGLRRNLEITGLQESVISTRQQGVRDAISSSGMQVFDSFLMGSYKRSTMIAPLKDADVDIFIVLSPDYLHTTPTKLLDQTKRVLRKRYTETSDISPNGQAVTIIFSDFKVDVVPGMPYEGGYLIPDTSKNRWIYTNPKTHIALWSKVNASHDGRFVPLLKMLKCWRRVQESPVRSFHLESMVLNAMRYVPFPDFPTGVRLFFEYASKGVSAFSNDPASGTGNMGDYLDLENFIRVGLDLEEGLRYSTEAERHRRSGRFADAYKMWHHLFGNYFPAFG